MTCNEWSNRFKKVLVWFIKKLILDRNIAARNRKILLFLDHPFPASKYGINAAINGSRGYQIHQTEVQIVPRAATFAKIELQPEELHTKLI
ncbi:hypothetical protein PR048_011742 [Dryococelus australis]|uniref:Uncharacterized protein n=1 Tax=Dryococelus australis TaxID=614101 RepID=A0ABQ9HMG4_9NEOP|nr:hypothetical protein PR048_011742 [Dryococelus australis]